MPSPSTSLSTLRPDIAGSFMEFPLGVDQGYIAYQALPVFHVARESGTFGKFTLEQLLQSPETRRAPGSGYNRIQKRFGTDTYACEEHGLEGPVDHREANMYAEYFDAELHTAMTLRDWIARAAEQRVSDALFNTSTFTPTTVTNEWDDATNATPIDDVEGRAQAMYDAIGLWPNALIINRKVFRNLRHCDQIINRIESSGAGSSSLAGQITRQQLAEAFDLPFILVAGSPKNTADEGQTASVSPIWSDEYAAVARIATSQNFGEPCIGRTMHWQADGSNLPSTVESYEETKVRSDIIRVRHDVDEKLLYTDCLQLLENITT